PLRRPVLFVRAAAEHALGPVRDGGIQLVARACKTLQALTARHFGDFVLAEHPFRLLPPSGQRSRRVAKRLEPPAPPPGSEHTRPAPGRRAGRASDETRRRARRTGAAGRGGGPAARLAPPGPLDARDADRASSGTSSPRAVFPKATASLPSP